MNVYIACGLTHVPRERFSEYVEFVQRLAIYIECTFCANVKYALKDSDPQLSEKPFEERARLCYLWDKDMVEWADVLVAEATYPSIGLGIELQIACTKETPIVLVFRTQDELRAKPATYETADNKIHDLQIGDGFVSLMALGMPSIFKIQPYENPEEANFLIGSALTLLQRPAAPKET